jgi:pantetheine-phosphate adenylyltransferase
MKIAIFPGSFDPITVGHIDLIERSVQLFDKIIVAVGENNQKNYLFTLQQRKLWLDKVFANHDKVAVESYNGLTADFAKERKAHYLIRGLRNASDFDYEKTISQLNNIIGKGLETVFFIAKPKLGHISSTIVREIIKGKGDVSEFVPQEVNIDLKTKFYI